MNFNELQDYEKTLFGLLENELRDIQFKNYFQDGSTARVFHILQSIGPDSTHRVDRIAKVFRPTHEISEAINKEKLFRNEIDKLVAISHTNLVALYQWGFIQDGGETHPYYIMEYIEGACDLDSWIEGNIDSKGRELFLDTLIQIANGIAALHKKNIIHCDIKFGNTIVGSSGTVKIADLGFAKKIKLDKGDTQLMTTQEYFPRAYMQYIRPFEQSNQFIAHLPRELINPTFDIHYFGSMIRALLLLPRIDKLFDQSDARALRIIVSRMLIPEPRGDGKIERTYSTLAQYLNIDHVRSDLEKLRRSYVNPAGIKELSSYTGTRTIRIPVSGSVAFSERVEKIISHPYFLRLNNALQLGFSHLVYPGANHTRYEHCVGVYNNVGKYINSLLADDLQPHFRHNVDEEKISTTLMAGLLHDIGQHSFAHGLEDIGMSDTHEEMSTRFIFGHGLESVVTAMTEAEPLIEIIEKYWPEVNHETLKWLITGQSPGLDNSDLGWDFMRAILSGPIDADKTDYLLRDAHHAGVEYANSIDITRFMNSLSASLLRKDDEISGVLAITWKGRQSAENIILARSQMFWVLYWHHAIRCAHAMLAHACDAHLSSINDDAQHTKYNETLYFGSPGEFLGLLEGSDSGKARLLSRAIRRRRLYKRGITLDYLDHKETYDTLVEKAALLSQQGDKLYTAISQLIADAVNAEVLNTLRKQGQGVEVDDIIVDIPKQGKDKLGELYTINKNEDYATKYYSEGLSGSYNDWQNRVRTIRIFVSPTVSDGARKVLREKGTRILQNVL